ncbi:MAG: CRISPR-associated helicase Cas3' [Gammaproteobacteria bacterium]|nr:CRISPR-associated helicase Cas3' [Gammaproteobacteria bacterium]MDP2347153.1 CRISPR-associated helicase Cas3' [Gammaproteobacteria bacterium]
MEDFQTTKSYWRYWGKAKPRNDGANYHLLAYHSLDVAAVGWVLLDPQKHLCKSLARQLNVQPEWLQAWFTFCLMLHDIGKFFRSFQNLAPNLSDRLVPYFAQCVYEKRHDTLGFCLWNNLLSRRLVDIIPSTYLKSMTSWVEIVCGHHGQPPEVIRTIKPYLLEEDELAAEGFVREVSELWLPKDLEPTIDMKVEDLRRTSWQFAGIAVLADWIGSNQDFFKYMDGKGEEISLENYWKNFALPSGKNAVEATHVGITPANPFSSIKQQFAFIENPTPLQNYAQSVTLNHSPQLFILEDVTGSGKTEAAMVLVHRLMSAGLAQGLYVGLPTMATANAMYKRMSQSYRQLFSLSALPSLVLSHGARELSAEFKKSVQLGEQRTDTSYTSDEPSASAYCNYWLADNRKKALLADVGIGTIDQALLGVLPARHQSLRMLGLTNKILVVDEVHAFDPYMRRLLIALLEAHAAQGGSAILLSATLPFTQRQQFVSAYATGAKFKHDTSINQTAYPLVTQLTDASVLEAPVSTRESVRRSVRVERLHNDEMALSTVLEVANQGRCICWIRNTVKDAHKAYKELLEAGMPANKLTLFHSRYAMIDRQRIEEDVLQRFGKTSTTTERKGQVLIATQVVEQSLDLDFDVMISDLAPIDLLIQRAGRLQRHLRDSEGNPLLGENSLEGRPKACLYLLSPDPEHVADQNWLRTLLPGTQAVYPNVGQLWLSSRTVLQRQGFNMPEDARDLIESVYGDDCNDLVPSALQDASLRAAAELKAQSGMGEFNRLKLEMGYTRSSAGQSGGWDEDVNIPTRLSSDSITVALARLENIHLMPYAQTKEDAWSLSQINLPLEEWNKAERLIPTVYSSAIDNLRMRIPQLKWLQILPLCSETTFLYDPVDGWHNTEKSATEASI